MYKLIFSKKSLKQLKKLDKITQNRLINVLKRIRIRPFNFIKRLVNLPFFSLRVGDYRIILTIKEKELIILVLEVGHRKNIYKK